MAQRHSAALVVSAFVEPGGNPPWYARISYYRDTASPAVNLSAQTSIEGVCDVVRQWLESVLDGQEATGEMPVTAP